MTIQNQFAKNTLYYGDNLEILREYIPSNYVDLVYLDPPFNSNRNYNILFKDESGKDSESQITAFDDTWHWNDAAEATYHTLIMDAPERISTMIAAMRQFIGPNQMMAYLVMMAARLVELHRVLKQSGSLWLHCDPSASHYLKIILDAIFSPEQFRGEIVWKRTSAHSSAKRPGPVHDILLFYSKSDSYNWIQQYQPYDESYLADFYRYTDASGRKYQLGDLTGAGTRNGETGLPWHDINPTAKGRHWAKPPAELDKLDLLGKIYWPPLGGMPRLKRFLDEMPGVPLQDIWDDIFPVGAQAAERLGYPTQKPLTLLERIIQASSNPEDIILDPFCGCGTAIAAAEKTGRKWIGIDITYLSIALQKYRMEAMFPGLKFNEVGIPSDVLSARALAQKDRYQFQFWALPLVNAKPVGGQEGSKQGKKGSDKGIDGIINFEDGPKHEVKRVIVQVKSGHVKSGDIRDLIGTVKRENAAIGVFITLEPPTSEMQKEATTAGYYISPHWGKYPAIQILTIDDLLHGAKVKMPFTVLSSTFKQAQKVNKIQAEQASMSL